jgi:phosphoribosylanthranilate isomerase
MMVKICGITNREDALVSIEGGAAALGFNFFRESPRYLEPVRAREITAVVPASVWKVGVFVNEAPEEALRIAAETGMDILQIHGNAASFPPGIRLWEAVRVGPDFHPEQLDSPNAEAFLLDTASATLHGGTGVAFDWKVARGLPHKVIVAGGIDETNVRQAIDEAQPWGVDACSRLEAAPGRKDHLKLAKFLKAALA